MKCEMNDGDLNICVRRRFVCLFSLERYDVLSSRASFVAVFGVCWRSGVLLAQRATAFCRARRLPTHVASARLLSSIVFAVAQLTCLLAGFRLARARAPFGRVSCVQSAKRTPAARFLLFSWRRVRQRVGVVRSR